MKDKKPRKSPDRSRNIPIREFKKLPEEVQSRYSTEFIEWYHKERRSLVYACYVMKVSASVGDYLIDKYDIPRKTKDQDHSDMVYWRLRTNEERYGTKSPFSRPDVIEKSKLTNLKKYGTTNVLCKDSPIRKNVEATNLERYGAKTPLESKVILDKIKSTNIERYGVDNVLKSPEIREKVKQTTLERYGVDIATKSPEVLARRDSNNRKKYGHKNFLESDVGRKKRADTLMEKYGATSGVQVHIPKENLIILNDRELLKEYLLNIPYEDRDKQEIIEKLGIGIAQFNLRLREWGLNSEIKFKKLSGTSNAENSVYEELIKIGVHEEDIIRNTRDIIRSDESGLPLELDFYLPKYHLAIEFNGIIWHDKDNPVRESRKTRLCEDQNILLIHIWEDDWNTDRTPIIEELKSFFIYEEVQSVEEVILDTPIQVYDIEVPNYHNFALANGLVVHNSADTLQALTTAGYDAKLRSLDRTPDGYLMTRSAIYEGRLSLLNINRARLEDEFLDVERTPKGKVDHSSDGSKDGLDSLVGATWNASQYKHSNYYRYAMSDTAATTELYEEGNTTEELTDQMFGGMGQVVSDLNELAGYAGGDGIIDLFSDL